MWTPIPTFFSFFSLVLSLLSQLLNGLRIVARCSVVAIFVSEASVLPSLNSIQGRGSKQAETQGPRGCSQRNKSKSVGFISGAWLDPEDWERSICNWSLFFSNPVVIYWNWIQRDLGFRKWRSSSNLTRRSKCSKYHLVTTLSQTSPVHKQVSYMHAHITSFTTPFPQQIPSVLYDILHCISVSRYTPPSQAQSILA